jgi:uncharacterized membrane protein YhaH (DUF805 family)
LVNPPASTAATDVPLWAPVYGTDFRIATRRFWKKYATFSGRASRSEYWWAMLFVGITGAVADVFTFVYLLVELFGLSADPRSAAPGPLFWASGAAQVVWALVFIVPTCAITARRLHDTDRSGWWVLLAFVPYGSIVILVFTVQQSNPVGQRFDLPPLPNSEP